MSKETIYREDAINAIRSTVAQYVPFLNGINMTLPLECEIALRSVPSADRPQGEWTCRDLYWHTAICSNCNKVTMFEEWDGEVMEYNYCPNCGARMKGADDDQE